MDNQNNNEQDLISDQMRIHAQYTSLGYSETHAGSAANVYACFVRGVEKLAKCKYGPSKKDGLDVIRVAAFGHDQPEEILVHNDVLLQDWYKFTDALSSVKPTITVYIVLPLCHVQLDTVVADMLLQSFKTFPLKQLSLVRNGLGRALVFCHKRSRGMLHS